MSFADPLSVTISGTAINLPRISTEGDETKYQSSDGLTSVEVQHQKTGKDRTRRQIRINTSKLTSNPYIPSENVSVSMSQYIVFDTPPAGYTAAEAKAVWDGFIASLQAGSGLLVTKLLAGES